MAGVVSGEFFGKQTEASKRKSLIVSNYFSAWAKIMTSGKIDARRINYLDLFAGPGQYDDGSKSTPLLILDQVLNSQVLRVRTKMYFNDWDATNIERLRKLFSNIDISPLSQKPEITNHDAAEYGTAIARAVVGYPTLSFVDPFGYRGVTQDLLGQLITPFGSDCIFFFNYNEIQRHINNPKVSDHMMALFGVRRADQLRELLAENDFTDKEEAILSLTAAAMRDVGGKHILFFRFRDKDDSRTSHHLAFISKNERGYNIMKEIMAKASSSVNKGVASLTYNKQAEIPKERQLSMFEEDPIETLKTILLTRFSGQTVMVGKLPGLHSELAPMEAHNYVLSNYKAALKQLEAEGKLQTSRPQRRFDTLADEILIYFPNQS